VFVAHVIDEDAENAPQQENHDQGGHDEKEDQNDPQPSDDDHVSDHQEAIIRSQYDSDQEGYPLDQYEEYVKVEDYSDEDADVVYIRVAQVMDCTEPKRFYLEMPILASSVKRQH
jgi:hypothetical protein